MPYCPECGADTGNSAYCPECGFPIAEYQQKLQSETISPNYSDDTRIENPAPTIPVNQTPPAFVPAPKKDWANYIYECWIIGWKAVGKYATFSGRASRREFWSFYLLCFILVGCTCFIFSIALLIPFLAVSWRRMHDINHSGWWCLIPFVSFFFCLKASDPTVNDYGYPFAATNYLND